MMIRKTPSLALSAGSSSGSFHRFVAALAVLTLLATAGVMVAPAADAQLGTLPEVPTATWQANGEVNVIHAVGDVLYIGGEFSELVNSDGSSVPRNNLAAINRLTGEPTSFNPDINGKIFAITESASPGFLFVGGNFTTVGGVARKRIAAFNVATGALAGFNPPGPNNTVKTLSATNSRLYIGGLFTQVGDQERDRLAAYNIFSQTLNAAWAPTANNDVKTVIADGNKVWLGGKFGRINNQPALGLAAVTTNDGSLIETDHPDYRVVALAVQDNRVLVAGAGRGGQAASYNRTTGAHQWTTSTNGNMQGVDGTSDWAYVGGHHDKVGDVEVGQMTRFDIRTGELDTSWLPDVNGKRGVNAIETVGDNVYIGGDFTFVSGERQQGFAAFGVLAPTGDAPQLNFMRIIDADKNGYIDTVKAFFDEDLADCPSGCTQGWALTNVPSGGTLRSARTEDNVAILNLNEGSGPADTTVGDLTIALSPSNNMPGVSGLRPTFAATAPRDGAGPAPILMYKTNAGTNGLAESGDTLEIRWSEPLLPASLPATTDVIIADLADGSNDTLTIDGIINGSMDLGSGDFLVCPTGPCNNPRQAVFANAAVTLSNLDRVTTITLGNCFGNCGMLMAGPTTTVTYKAPSTITDVSAKPATGSRLERTFRIF